MHGGIISTSKHQGGTSCWQYITTLPIRNPQSGTRQGALRQVFWRSLIYFTPGTIALKRYSPFFNQGNLPGLPLWNNDTHSSTDRHSHTVRVQLLDTLTPTLFFENLYVANRFGPCLLPLRPTLMPSQMVSQQMRRLKTVETIYRMRKFKY
jgi:hypothetical protein